MKVTEVVGSVLLGVFLLGVVALFIAGVIALIGWML